MQLSKVVCVFLPVVIILSSGCRYGNGEKSTSEYKKNDTYIAGQDSQEYMYFNNRQLSGENENSVFWSSLTSDYISVIDKDRHTLSPLCDKTDCLHYNETDPNKKKQCNAYIGVHKSLVYCSDRLYYDNVGEYTDKDGNKGVTAEIFSEKADGTDRKELFEFKDIVITWFRIHRGYLYYLTADHFAENDQTGKVALYRVPLNGKEADAKELIPFYEYGEWGKNIILRDGAFYGNSIYMCLDYKEMTNEELADDKATVDLTIDDRHEIKFDLESKTWTDLNEKTSHKITMPMFINNKLVYSAASEGGNNVFYECDLDGSNEREVLTVSAEKDLSFRTDGKSLISVPEGELGSQWNETKITVYDSDYRPAAVYDTKGTSVESTFCSMCVEDLFFFIKTDAFDPDFGEYYTVDRRTLNDGDIAQPVLSYEKENNKTSKTDSSQAASSSNDSDTRSTSANSSTVSKNNSKFATSSVTENITEDQYRSAADEALQLFAEEYYVENMDEQIDGDITVSVVNSEIEGKFVQLLDVQFVTEDQSFEYKLTTNDFSLYEKNIFPRTASSESINAEDGVHYFKVSDVYTPQEKVISNKKAIEIALEDLGLENSFKTHTDILQSGTQCNKHFNDVSVFDYYVVKFSTKTDAYEYHIDSHTGEIVDKTITAVEK